MAAKRHIHEYYFGLNIAGTKVWACAAPDCQHYMPKHMEDLVNGRLAKCWKCGDKTIIDVSMLKTGEYELGKVFCEECITMANLSKGVGKIIRDKTDEERKAELMAPALEAIKCKKCHERQAMTSQSHGMCAICAYESI